MSVYIRKRKRKKGYVYELTIDRTNAAGVRSRKTRTLPLGIKKSEAESIARRIQLELDFGQYIDREPITLADYYDNVYRDKYISISDLSPTTVRGYNQIFNVDNGLRDLLGNEYINNISTDMIQDYVNKQVSECNRSPKTIRNHIGLLSKILERAMISKYVTKKENPIKYIILPKTQKRQVQAYTLSEVRYMMAKAEETNNLTALSIIALTCLGGGLRRSELAGLKMSNCFVENEYQDKYISIEETIVQVKGGQAIRHGKTESAVRKVPIGDTLASIILKQKIRNKEKKLNAGEEFEGGDYLLLMGKSPYAPMKPNYIYITFKKFMREFCPELPCLRLHDLRATYASIGADLQFKHDNLKTALGHSDISTTERFYIKNYDDSLKADVQKLEEAYLNTEVKQA